MKQKTTLISLLLAMALLLIQGMVFADDIEEATQYLAQKQYDKAYVPIKRLAEKGNAVAQEALGEMYYLGRGIKQDPAEAAKWFRKAANQGREGAQYILGALYENGIGVKQDLKEAFRLYRMAASQGVGSAELRIGQFYLYGMVVEENHAEAFKWHLKAAERNEKEAYFILAYLYDFGVGIKADESQAEKWYQKAIEDGSIKAAYRLGYIYVYGKKRQPEKGIELIRKAAEAGYHDAQGALGFEYERGLYLDKDFAKAREWYQKSAAQGNEQAKQMLQSLP